MAIEKKTIRLLILEDSQNEAERLVSLFRNAGHATRVHRLTSPEDLAETLQQSWDLLIAAPTSECLEPGEALATLRRQSRDIPFIQLVADNSSDAITDALMLGAQDALPQGEDERLVLVANRELAGLAERRARRAAPPNSPCARRKNAASCCSTARSTPSPTSTTACTSTPTAPTWRCSATRTPRNWKACRSST